MMALMEEMSKPGGVRMSATYYAREGKHTEETTTDDGDGRDEVDVTDLVHFG
jgi:hypothetical protein